MRLLEKNICHCDWQMLIREICGEMVFMTELDQLRGWYQKKMEEFGVFELHGGQAFWTGTRQNRRMAKLGIFPCLRYDFVQTIYSSFIKTKGCLSSNFIFEKGHLRSTGQETLNSKSHDILIPPSTARENFFKTFTFLYIFQQFARGTVLICTFAIRLLTMSFNFTWIVIFDHEKKRARVKFF